MANLVNIRNQHPFVRQVVSDKIRGLIIGSAVGDAIGLYTEFLDKAMCRSAYPKGKFTLTGDITHFCNDSHRNKFVEGSWTDDTDHSLLIVLSYLHSDGKELSFLDLAKRLRSWVEQGLRCLDRLPLGLGQTMGRVIVSDTFLNDPKDRAFQSWVNSNFTAAPNGSLMRTHPLSIMCLDKTQQETFEVATAFSAITHADPRCSISCCIVTDLLRGILLGQIQTEHDIDDIVEKAIAYVEALPVPDHSIRSATGTSPPSSTLDKQELYRHTKATTYEDLQLDDLRKQGYVYKCLGSALLSLRLAMQRTTHVDAAQAEQPNHQPAADVHLSKHKVFETLITDLTMQGGDADTNATVAGALVGAYLGFDNLPPHWYNGLKDIQWLMSKTNGLIQVVGVDGDESGTTSKYIGSQDRDTRPDGGKGFLTKEQLEKREMAFMEMYLTKTGHGRANAAKQSAAGGTSDLMKRLKGVFG